MTFDKIKYGAKLTATAAFSFFKINIIGSVLTAIVVVASFLIMIGQCFGNGPGPGHASAGAFLVILFSMRPVAFILTTSILFISPIILFALGNKYILLKTANRLIKDKGESLLSALIEKIILRVKEKQPELLKKGADATKLKLKFLQEIKDSNDNKWIKRITTYGLNKINLNEIDFGDEHLSFSEIVKLKIFNSIQNIGKPSEKFFWITIIVQFLVLLLIILKII